MRSFTLYGDTIMISVVQLHALSIKCKRVKGKRVR